MDGDLVLVVLVETHVGEELPGSGIAKSSIGEEVDRFRAGAGLDLAAFDGDRARGDPGSAGHQPFPAVFDRHHPVTVESEVRLVVHAVEALDHRLLDVVDSFGRHAGLRVDLAQGVVMDLDFEVA
ncbi:MAG: hypothetical protein IPK93_12225 [Solirubrobacterales bacterium]|nr:hypothetical protein [Solirubrobacterales bacterium]